MIIPLNASAQAVADATGKATVRIYQPTAGSSWVVERMITSVTGAGVTSQSVIDHSVYTNSVSETNRKDNTQSAIDTSETKIPLQASEFLIGTYASCPPGSICTLTVTGTVNTGR